jgi:threonine dehydrogenase-like Zn-dependent dehydrogenase
VKNACSLRVTSIHGRADSFSASPSRTRRAPFAYAPRDFHDSVDLLESRRVDIRAFTETRPLEDGQVGFLKMTRDPGATLKLVLTP